jgi:hypothetical protein
MRYKMDKTNSICKLIEESFAILFACPFSAKQITTYLNLEGKYCFIVTASSYRAVNIFSLVKKNNFVV